MGGGTNGRDATPAAVPTPLSSASAVAAVAMAATKAPAARRPPPADRLAARVCAVPAGAGRAALVTGAFSICLPQTWARCLPREAAQSEEEVFRALIIFFAVKDFVLLSEVARFRWPAVAAMIGGDVLPPAAGHLALIDADLNVPARLGAQQEDGEEIRCEAGGAATTRRRAVALAQRHQ